MDKLKKRAKAKRRDERRKQKEAENRQIVQSFRIGFKREGLNVKANDKEIPEAETTGGYLKKLDNTGCAVTWWHKLSDYEKDIIKGIPNFDKAIFKEITGIDVGEEEET